MHFLIVKTSSLGDILHTLPAVMTLLKKFPQAKIDWVVEKRCSELVSAFPMIQKTIVIDTREGEWGREELKKERYDVAFDFQGNIKSSLLLMRVRAQEKVGFGRKGVSEWPNLFFTTWRKNPPPGRNIREDLLYLVERYYNISGSLDIEMKLRCDERQLEDILKFPAKILACPGAFWPNKQISVERWIDLLKDYRDEPLFFAWGNDAEKSFVEKLIPFFPKLKILPRLSLPLLQNLMGKMELVIAMDSLPLHLAATTKVKTLSVFGPSLGKKYAPLGERHRYIQGNCPYGLKFTKRCPRLRTCKTGACMEDPWKS